MSSNEDEHDAAGVAKKRRIQRACDVCRRKKIRCDGAGSRCSNCTTYGFDCSYVEAAKKRGPPKGYVESLQDRIEKIERLLQTIVPELDLERELAGSSPTKWDTPGPPDDDERIQLSLTENLQELSLGSDRDTRFFGRSSGAMLIQTALNVKADVEPQNDRRHTEFWSPRPSPEPVPRQQYTFPPPDLAASLVGLYFARVNLLIPLLHRPTFARELAAGLHHTNDIFAATFLLVCAVGSRFSADPRVLLDDTAHPLSSGWRWFEQLQMVRDPDGPPAGLYDLQFYALTAMFLHGTSAPQAAWTMVGIGIRMAQDVGAHRRKEPTHRWTAEDEAWKRAFWVLVVLDRMMSVHYGRQCAIQDEDIDLDFPIDCDDEYWEPPDVTQAFRQPPGKPSRVAAFIASLRLVQILSFAMRTTYSINKPKFFLGLSKGTSPDWEVRVFAELDAALNRWIDEMPDHLRWDPTRENPDFFEQSVMLHCSYYHMQIIIHRPSPKKASPLPFPSLAICTNAARSCCHVVDIFRQRTGGHPLYLGQTAVFMAALVLLLNIWGGRRSGLSTDAVKEMADVHRCMQVLRDCEPRWQSAGRLWDILYELASVSKLPLPAPSMKRERGAEEPKSATHERRADSLSSSGSSGMAEHLMAGRARVPPPTVPSHTRDGGDAPVSESRSMARSRRLPTSDVPAITTQFVPHFQQRQYAPETPLSAASLHTQHLDAFGLAMHSGGALRTHAPGPPDTPLSASSLHSRDAFGISVTAEEVRPRRPHAPAPPDTPLSASSLRSHGHPDAFVPSMHHRPPDYAHPRALLERAPAGEGEEYWYASELPTAPSHGPARAQHTQSAVGSSNPNPKPTPNPHTGSHLPVGAALTSSFPMSEAFYEHLTASFSSGDGARPRRPSHVHPPPAHPHAHAESYPAQAHNERTDGVRPSGAHSQPVHGGPGDSGPAQWQMDQDTMALWAAAPIGFELADWGSYLNSVNEITQGRTYPSASGSLL
ncbi:fungal-specific transcription factor domain-containing protein [Mycena sp. CBHHK59/15]|nr:fungal-specific transcription factor domain-containing protein [Mycena sp. CBHHK59/15]